MTRTFGVSVENNFSRGIITEATGLNYPENAATEADNVIFSEKIKVIRRLGIDYENTATLTNSREASLRGDSIVEFLWRNASNQGTVAFQVQQLGATIHFYSASASSLSAAKDSFTIDLSSYEITSGAARLVECQFASGDGKLFIVSEAIDPIYVTYNVPGDSITVTQINPKIRDFDGLEDFEASPEDRPTSLTIAHNYNLKNQGWYVSALDSDGDITNVLTFWDDDRSDFPSNVDVWWKYKNASQQFDLDEVDTIYVGNTYAPKGHFFLNAWLQDRDAVSGLSGIVDVDATTRPTTVAFFSGRVWMAGVNADGFGSKLYFSQIAEKPAQFSRMYQDQDPTSEDFSQLLPSDGGVIIIPEMGVCKKLFILENALFVFATNGIWAISGSQNEGFRANNYSVYRVSNIGALDHKSFVDVNGIPYWWNNEGIFTLQQDPQTQKISAFSISDSTIKSFFDKIPLDSRQWIKGAYNDSTKVIQWLFRSTTPDGTATEERYQYNRSLHFNTINQAFYPYSISSVHPTQGPFISGIIAIKGLGAIREEEDVYDNNVLVTEGGVPVTTITGLTAVSLAQVFKYFTTAFKSRVWTITFSQEIDTTYTDWASYNNKGVDFSSYFLTGFKVHGQAIRKFSTSYLQVYMETETDASLFCEAYWNFSLAGATGQVSTSQQVYSTLNTNYVVAHSRIKIRGSGVSLQLKFYSETAKPFTLIGWAGLEISNVLP